MTVTLDTYSDGNLVCLQMLDQALLEIWRQLQIISSVAMNPKNPPPCSVMKQMMYYHDTRQRHAVREAFQLEKVSLVQVFFRSHVCARLSDQDFR